jgi:hypothetical protein
VVKADPHVYHLGYDEHETGISRKKKTISKQEINHLNSRGTYVWCHYYGRMSSLKREIDTLEVSYFPSQHTSLAPR